MSTDGPPVATFFDVGRNMKEGLPFTPWAAGLRKQRMASHDADNPDAHCLPLGFMQLHTHSQPREIVQTPSVIVIAYEANYGLRNIFMDGRQLPPNDPQPWWYGYSVGHWEGDTLVVDTVGVRDDTWFDRTGAPHSDQLHIVMRIRKTGPDTIENNMTLDDPVAITKPWKVTRHFKRAKNYDIREFVCEENNRNPIDQNGKSLFIYK
jgi:hypothetical protein